jgi:hypothetical protein
LQNAGRFFHLNKKIPALKKSTRGNGGPEIAVEKL